MGPAKSPVLEKSDDDKASGTESPYTATRALMRELTLPTVPNFDIPPSPPGSPPPQMEAIVARFIEMKKKGMHFNEKLATTSSMKNPSLFSKIMRNIGMDESEQYGTTLPTELWNPNGFPPWAYKEELAKTQQAAQKKREEDLARRPREAIDFVPATASAPSSRATTPGSKASNQSAAKRVIASLSRDRDGGRPHASRHDRRRSRSPSGRR